MENKLHFDRVQSLQRTSVSFFFFFFRLTLLRLCFICIIEIEIRRVIYRFDGWIQSDVNYYYERLKWNFFRRRLVVKRVKLDSPGVSNDYQQSEKQISGPLVIDKFNLFFFFCSIMQSFEKLPAAFYHHIINRSDKQLLLVKIFETTVTLRSQFKVLNHELERDFHSRWKFRW